MMGANAWTSYCGALAALSATELALILLSLLGGCLYLARARSWQLLAQQTVLLPLLIAYMCYLFFRGHPSGSFLVLAYHSALFSIAHVVVVLGLIDRRPLLWAFFGKQGHPPGIPRIGLRDAGFTAAIAAAGFAVCMYSFSVVISMIS